MTLLPTDIDPLYPLQRAMYATLTADAVLPTLSESGSVDVFDRVSDGVFPYITIGEDRQVPDDLGDCGTMSEVFSTVRVYSRGQGRKEAKRIAGRVRWLLDKDRGFSVDGFLMPVGVCESMDPRTHQDGVTVHYELNFRYMLSALDPRHLGYGVGSFAPLNAVAVGELSIAAVGQGQFAPLQSTALANIAESLSGVANGQFAPLAGQAAGSLALEASAAGAFAPLSGASIANYGTDLTGMVNASFAPLNSSASGSIALEGQAAGSFAPLSSNAVAQYGNDLTGVVQGAFAPIMSVSTASLALIANGSAGFAPLSGQSAAELSLSATASGQFAPLSSNAVGSVDGSVDAVAVGSFAPLNSNAVGSLALEAQSAAAFAPLDSNSAASLEIQANAAGSFAPLSGAATGSVHVGAVANGQFAPLSSVSAASLALEASANGSFAPISSTAVGDISAGSSNEAETDTLLAAMTTAPDATREGHINTLIAGLKADGIWAKLDLFYMLAAHAEQPATLNWMDPANHIATFASGGFTVDEGQYGANSGGTLKFRPAWTWGDRVNIAQGDAHAGQFHGFFPAPGSTRICMSLGGKVARIDSDGDVANGMWRRFNASNGTIMSPESDRHFVDNELGGVNGGYLDGVLNCSSTQTLETFVDTDAIQACRNYTLRCFHLGAGLTATEIANLNTRIRTYLTGIGII